MTATLRCKTTQARGGQVARQWYIVDAEGMALGRLASSLATILMGKHKPIYTPHIDVGDFVIVKNAEKVKITGRKLQQETHDYYTYYPSGHKYVSYETLLEKHPERLIEFAVRRMLPKTRLGRQMYKKLKAYRGSNHPHQAQQPRELDLSEGLDRAFQASQR